MGAWLRAAGGSPLTALIGKLLPLFAVFVLMMVVVAAIVHGFFHVPFRGNSLIMGAAACLLVIGYLAMGALFALLTRNLALGLSITANLLLSGLRLCRRRLPDPGDERFRPRLGVRAATQMVYRNSV